MEVCIKSTKHSIKEDRRLRSRPAKFISPGQARGDGKTKLTKAEDDATRMRGVGKRMEADPKSLRKTRVENGEAGMHWTVIQAKSRHDIN